MGDFSFKAIDPAAHTQFPRVVLWLLGYSALMALVAWILPFVFGFVGREVLSLHTTIFFGIDLIGPGNKALALPALATIIMMTHGLLLYYFRRVTYLVMVFALTLVILESIIVVGLWWLHVLNPSS